MQIDPTALRRARETAGHSQTTLAAASGIAQSHISKLERERSDVRPPTAKALADELGVEIEDLEHAAVAS